jgi:hypothetical protein
MRESLVSQPAGKYQLLKRFEVLRGRNQRPLSQKFVGFDNYLTVRLVFTVLNSGRIVLVTRQQSEF